MLRDLTQPEIIDMLNTCCDTALDLLNLRNQLEETGHVLQCQAMIIYNANMVHFYQTDKIA